MTNNGERIRVAMLEDDASYIDTLRLVIDTDPHLTYVAGFRSPMRFLAAIEDLDIDVLLLDINMPKLSGIECIDSIKQAKPDLRLIMLTVEDRRETVLEAFSTGADGYLLKDASPEKVGKAIREVKQGGAPMSPSIARLVIGMLRSVEQKTPDRGDSKALDNLLTGREREVLHFLADGLQYSEIADKLFVSQDTIKSHIRSIYQKLGVRNRMEAVKHLL